jgi:hypothetical protein
MSDITGEQGQELESGHFTHHGRSECPRCYEDCHYLDHILGDHTEIDGTLHVLCPHCKEEYYVPQ